MISRAGSGLGAFFEKAPAFRFVEGPYPVPWERIAFVIICAFVVIWNIDFLDRAISFAHMPDEIWFYQSALHNYRDTDYHPVFSPNYFAYGGVWFSLYHGCIILSGLLTGIDYTNVSIEENSLMMMFINGIGEMLPMIMMRIISILSINAMLIVMLVRLWKKEIFAFYALLFLLISPMLYWSGKLASPDLPAAALAFLGVFYFLRHARLIAYLFLGLAIGVKLSTLPILLAVFLWHSISVAKAALRKIPRTSREEYLLAKLQLRDEILALLFCPAITACTFLLCNLYLIVQPTGFAKNFFDAATFLINDGLFESYASFYNSIAERLFSYDGLLWDLSYSGSLAYWSTSLYLLFGLAIASLFLAKDRNVLPLIGIAFILSLALILRQPAFGWNWFPLVTLIPLIIMNFRETRVSHVWLGIFFLGAIHHNYGLIHQERSSSEQHQANIQYHLNYSNGLEARIKAFSGRNSFRIVRILNLGELGINYERAYSFEKSFWEKIQRLRPGDLVIVGDRTMRFIPWVVEEDIKPKFVYMEDRAGFLTFYYLVRRVNPVEGG
jgi:hypothetical protein